jgi:serine/threonine protein kinase
MTGGAPRHLDVVLPDGAATVRLAVFPGTDAAELRAELALLAGRSVPSHGAPIPLVLRLRPGDDRAVVLSAALPHGTTLYLEPLVRDRVGAGNGRSRTGEATVDSMWDGVRARRGGQGASGPAVERHRASEATGTRATTGDRGADADENAFFRSGELEDSDPADHDDHDLRRAHEDDTETDPDLDLDLDLDDSGYERDLNDDLVDGVLVDGVLVERRRSARGLRRTDPGSGLGHGYFHFPRQRHSHKITHAHGHDRVRGNGNGHGPGHGHARNPIRRPGLTPSPAPAMTESDIRFPPPSYARPGQSSNQPLVHIPGFIAAPVAGTARGLEPLSTSRAEPAVDPYTGRPARRLSVSVGDAFAGRHRLLVIAHLDTDRCSDTWLCWDPAAAAIESAGSPPPPGCVKIVKARAALAAPHNSPRSREIELLVTLRAAIVGPTSQAGQSNALSPLQRPTQGHSIPQPQAPVSAATPTLDPIGNSSNIQASQTPVPGHSRSPAAPHAFSSALPPWGIPPVPKHSHNHLYPSQEHRLPLLHAWHLFRPQIDNRLMQARCPLPDNTSPMASPGNRAAAGHGPIPDAISLDHPVAGGLLSSDFRPIDHGPPQGNTRTTAHLSDDSRYPKPFHHRGGLGEYSRRPDESHPWQSTPVSVESMLDEFVVPGAEGSIHACSTHKLRGPSLVELGRLFNNRGCPMNYVRKLALSILEGVEWIHERAGFIHGYLKPESIVVTPSTGDCVKVARAADEFVKELRKYYAASGKKILTDLPNQSRSCSENQLCMPRDDRVESENSAAVGATAVQVCPAALSVQSCGDDTVAGSSSGPTPSGQAEPSENDSTSAPALPKEIEVGASTARPWSSEKGVLQSEGVGSEGAPSGPNSRRRPRHALHEHVMFSVPDVDGCNILPSGGDSVSHAQAAAEPVLQPAFSMDGLMDVDEMFRHGRIRLIDLERATWRGGKNPCTQICRSDDPGIPYRSPEMISGTVYGSSTDIWAVGCILFELATGDRLFEPHRSPHGHYSRDADHLAQIVEHVGSLPPGAAMRGSRARELFDRFGCIRGIGFDDLEPWPIEQVLIHKYELPAHDAKALSRLLGFMLNTDPSKRATARQCIELNRSFFEEIETLPVSDLTDPSNGEGQPTPSRIPLDAVAMLKSRPRTGHDARGSLSSVEKLSDLPQVNAPVSSVEEAQLEI